MRSDDALVTAARTGDLTAFDSLMLRYQKLVCKVAMSYVKTRQDGLDVTQNVFLKAYGNLASVTSEGMFKPWLLRITYNESINWLRKHKRRNDHDPIDEHEPETAPEAGQDRAVLADEQRRLVAEGLGTLNPKYRMALALRYAEGLRIREIAAAMECSEGMVKSLLFRGVRMIKKRLPQG